MPKILLFEIDYVSKYLSVREQSKICRDSKNNASSQPFLQESLSKLIFCRQSIKKGKRKVQGMPQSQTAALPRHQEEEETGKTKQTQIKQTYEKH